ncbi:MAG TPA: cutinase family protein [Candidatus Corynebacterium gallistercoris]|uniref:Cutinase family protein n=1 Tax=Candidatus Corynebacterium gallistercoris TaxID=2838530 RepID=A0A9D1RY67_9CORY|nr:cutinase family protein [Candidatus Corynebacterium gallistercoris]
MTTRSVSRRVFTAAAAALTTVAAFAAVPTPAASAQPGIAGSVERFGGCTSTVTAAVPGGAQSLAGIPEALPMIGYSADVVRGVRARGQATRTIHYNATPFLASTYQESTRKGRVEVERALSNLANECPNSRIALVGYSQGADIAAQIAVAIGEGRGPIPADRLKQVILLASPYNGPASQGPGSAPVETRGTGVLGAMPSYGSIAGKVTDLCVRGDMICDSAAVPASTSVAGRAVTMSLIGGTMQFDAGDFFAIAASTPAMINSHMLHVGGYGHQVGHAVNLITS